MKYILILLLSMNVYGNIEYPFDDDYELTSKFTDTLANTETEFDKEAVSDKGAYGMFQILPIACEDAGVDCGENHKPSYEKQYKVMSHYVKKWFEKTGCIYKTLFIYNQGRRNFIKHERKTGGNYDYKTHKYVKKFIRKYKEYDKIVGFMKWRKGAIPVWKKE